MRQRGSAAGRVSAACALACALAWVSRAAAAQDAHRGDTATAPSPAPVLTRASATRYAYEDPIVTPVPPDLTGVERVLYVAAALLSLLPGSVGGDLSIGPRVRQGPRALVSWPVQIPLRFVRPNANAPQSFSRTAVYSNHRIVLAPELALGPQRGPEPTLPTSALEEPLVTLRARAHYRFVHHPRGGFFGWFAAAGSTLEFWPLVRPSLGAELGLHLGSCCNDATAVLTVTLRVDGFFAGDDPLRLGALVGWAFY